MYENKKHIIINIFLEILGKNNVLSIWKSSKLSSIYGIDYYCSISLDNKQDEQGVFTSSFLISVEIMKKTDNIVEVSCDSIDLHHTFDENNDILLYGSAPTSPKFAIHRDNKCIKGYYNINSIAYSRLAKKYNLYEKAFSRIKEIALDPSDSMYGTAQMLLYVYNNLPEEKVYKWFEYDTPLIRWLRQSSPFFYVTNEINEEELFKEIQYIVNNPTKFPPRESYDIWKNNIINKGGIHINDFTKKYLPKREQ